MISKLAHTAVNINNKLIIWFYRKVLI